MSSPEFDASVSKRQPIFNLPWIITTLIGLMAVIHFGRTIVEGTDFELLINWYFAFIPARYGLGDWTNIAPFAIYWSPFSYSFLHADWVHLIMNSVWLLAFGGVVARRLGAVRFMLLFIIGAICGAALHYVFHSESMTPMIGASASVSACMASAIRLPVFLLPGYKGDLSQIPIRSLVQTFTNRQALTFVGVWFAINFIFGAGLIDIAGEGQSIAWEAHIGGFVAGLFLLGLIDIRKQAD